MKCQRRVAAFLLAAAVSLSAESFTYQTITVPGSTSTSPVGIDNDGQIVGNYTNSNGTYGFIDTGGIFTTLASGDHVINVSSNRNVLLSTSSGYATYFGGTFSPLQLPLYNSGYALPTPPGPNLPITPTAINDQGQLLGTAAYANLHWALLITGNQVTSEQNTTENIFDLGEYAVQFTGLNDHGQATLTDVHADHSLPFTTTVYGGIYNPSTNYWTFLQAPNNANTDFNGINNSAKSSGA